MSVKACDEAISDVAVEKKTSGSSSWETIFQAYFLGKKP